MAASLVKMVLDTFKPLRGRRNAVFDTESTISQPPSHQRYRRLAKIAVLTIPIWCLWFYLNSQHPIYHASGSPSPSPRISSAFLHFLLPGATGGTPYCRTLFSAGALNYPTARLINWAKDSNNTSRNDGGMSMGTIDGVLDFLRKLDASHDEELVLVADGYDTWFQLRPEVLLTRYFAIKERTEQQISLRYAPQYDSSIVFSAQRHCEDEEDAWACTAIPQSPLPVDIYGSRTDHIADDVSNTHPYQRPRYLNSGMVIGPAGRMRKLYEYAYKKSENSTVGTDQQIFSQIFGEQEYSRQTFSANTSRIHEGELANDPRIGQAAGERIALGCGQCQFGITLDYFNELSMPTIYSERHMTYATYNATGSLTLPHDIVRSTPPYWTPDYSGQTDLPSRTWSQLPLLSDRNTKVVPVAVHHHAGANTTEMWPRQWYHEDLRKLVTGHAKSFRVPFAVLSTGKDSVQEYWGPNDGYGGVRVHNKSGIRGDWKQWDEVCGGRDVGNDVFGDGQGAYQSPVYYLYWDAQKQSQQLDTWWQRNDEERRHSD